jgi:hypothetical protein
MGILRGTLIAKAPMPTVQRKPENPTAGPDLRLTARRRALLGGMIVARDGTSSSNCTIRELSEGGARIEVPRATNVPSKVYLLTSRQASAQEAQIVWRNATQAGLKLGAVHELSPKMNSDMRHLWRLYLELRPRAFDNTH